MSETINNPITTTKLPDGYAFYNKIGRPKYICAPMVEQSEVQYNTFYPYIFFLSPTNIYLVSISFINT